MGVNVKKYQNNIDIRINGKSEVDFFTFDPQ